MDLKNVIIESPRLIQIPISGKYKHDIFNSFTPEVAKFMYPKTHDDISETEGFLEFSRKGLEDGNNLQMVILKKSNNEFLGCSGIHDLDTDTPETGLWLKESAHGFAYGKETIEAIYNWAKQNLNFKYIKYSVERENISSIKIPEMLEGKVHREYKMKNMAGRIQDLLEYRIYNNLK
jgi:ribosomal-protein-alanine N-acetyltransferase